MLTGDSGLRVEDCLRRPFNLHDLDRSLGTILLPTASRRPCGAPAIPRATEPWIRATVNRHKT
jgi:hypothetical protein